MKHTNQKANNLTIRKIFEVNGKKGLFYIIKFEEIRVPNDHQAFFLFDRSQSFHLIQTQQFKEGDKVNIEYYIKNGTDYHNITQINRVIQDNQLFMKGQRKITTGE